MSDHIEHACGTCGSLLCNGEHAQREGSGFRVLGRLIKKEDRMSLEAWGDEGDCAPDGYVTTERAEEAFVEGAQAAREMLARFVEQGGDHVTAASIRANWHPEWGKDPGKLDGPIPIDPWGSTEKS